MTPLRSPRPTARSSRATVPTPPGRAGNLIAGTVLSLTTGVTGLDGTATVTAAFTGGTDQESVEEFRKRIVRTTASPRFSGNSAHGVSWIESVAGVRRGFVRPAYDGPGTVQLMFQSGYNGGRDGRIAPALKDEVQTYFWSQVADVAEVNAVCALPVALPVDVEVRVAARPGYEFDWSGSMAATAASATTFTVAALPANLAVGHRVVWAATTGDDRMQRIATVQALSAGAGPYTVTLAGLGFGITGDVGASHFTGSQTIYPAGDLTTAVQTALLREGGAFDKLTPGDLTTFVTGGPRPRFPPVGVDYPTDLRVAEINSAVFGAFGVNDVRVMLPTENVVPAVGEVVVPRQFLIRPL